MITINDFRQNIAMHIVHQLLEFSIQLNETRLFAFPSLVGSKKSRIRHNM